MRKVIVPESVHHLVSFIKCPSQTRTAALLARPPSVETYLAIVVHNPLSMPYEAVRGSNELFAPLSRELITEGKRDLSRAASSLLTDPTGPRE
jgi:hypothetical protein